MFRIKICGVTTVDDARVVAASGADALGLNFFEGSRRFLADEQAAKIADVVPAGIKRIGVFVNAEPQRIFRAAGEFGLDAVQLHGNESPEFCAQFRSVPIVRAFRLAGPGIEPVVEYVAACQRLGLRPAAILVDAFVPGQYGGTGTVLRWSELAELKAKMGGVPLVVAGGLTPDNVGQAIGQARPDGVDTASGVESAAGIKDPAKVAAFVRAAANALHAINS